MQGPCAALPNFLGYLDIKKANYNKQLPKASIFGI